MSYLSSPIPRSSLDINLHNASPTRYLHFQSTVSPLPFPSIHSQQTFTTYGLRLATMDSSITTILVTTTSRLTTGTVTILTTTRTSSTAKPPPAVFPPSTAPTPTPTAMASGNRFQKRTILIIIFCMLPVVVVAYYILRKVFDPMIQEMRRRKRMKILDARARRETRERLLAYELYP